MRSGWCPRQPLSPPVPSRSIQQAIVAALPIVLTLILLPTLAFASPPDPSWVAGFYDGADGDDIVSLVYETSAANHTAPSHLGPLPCLLDMYLDSSVRHVPDCHFSRGPRSPPVLRSSEFVSIFNSLPPPTPFKEAPATLPSLACPARCCDPKMKVSANALSFAPHSSQKLTVAPLSTAPAPRVAASIPASRKFCGTCGKPLAAQPAPAARFGSPEAGYCVVLQIHVVDERFGGRLTRRKGLPSSASTVQNLRDNRSVNNIGVIAGDRNHFGANITPAGGSTITGVQGAFNTGAAPCGPTTTDPNLRTNAGAFSSTRLGFWSLTFRNGTNTATIATPTLAGAENPVPFAQDVAITRSDHPTISFTAPHIFGRSDSPRFLSRPTRRLK